MLAFPQHPSIAYLQILETFVNLWQQGEQAPLQYNTEVENWGQQEAGAKDVSPIFKHPTWGTYILTSADSSHLAIKSQTLMLLLGHIKKFY